MYELPNFVGSTEHPQGRGLAGGSSGGGSAGSGGGWLKGLWGVNLVEVAAVLGGWLDLYTKPLGW